VIRNVGGSLIYENFFVIRPQVRSSAHNCCPVACASALNEHMNVIDLKDAELASHVSSGKRKLEPVPSSYHKKYEHLLGKEAAKDAARATDANKSYGFGTQFQNIL